MIVPAIILCGLLGASSGSPSRETRPNVEGNTRMSALDVQESGGLNPLMRSRSSSNYYCNTNYDEAIQKQLQKLAKMLATSGNQCCCPIVLLPVQCADSGSDGCCETKNTGTSGLANTFTIAKSSTPDNDEGSEDTATSSRNPEAETSPSGSEKAGPTNIYVYTQDEDNAGTHNNYADAGITEDTPSSQNDTNGKNGENTTSTSTSTSTTTNRYIKNSITSSDDNSNNNNNNNNNSNTSSRDDNYNSSNSAFPACLSDLWKTTGPCIRNIIDINIGMKGGSCNQSWRTRHL